MPKFTTISPTCQQGGKAEAWHRFRDGGYIAIGWCYENDLSEMTLTDALNLVPKDAAGERDKQDGLRSFPIFWELAKRGTANAGDIVAVKNTNDGLFGIGVVRSGYRYDRQKHPTGVMDHFYPHYLEVEWIWTEYIARSSIDFGGAKSWMPFGTFGNLEEEVPGYVLPYLKRHFAR